MSSYNLLTNANYCCLYYELWYDLTIKEPQDKTQNAELSAPKKKKKNGQNVTTVLIKKLCMYY